MSQLPTRECQYERRVSDLSDRGAKSVRSLNPQQDVPMPLKGEDISNGLQHPGCRLPRRRALGARPLA